MQVQLTKADYVSPLCVVYDGSLFVIEPSGSFTECELIREFFNRVNTIRKTKFQLGENVSLIVSQGQILLL